MKSFPLHTWCAALLLTFFFALLLSPGASAASAVSSASAPRRALLVEKEVGLAVDPVGVVRSVELSSSVTFNFFCEFVRLGPVGGVGVGRERRKPIEGPIRFKMLVSVFISRL